MRALPSSTLRTSLPPLLGGQFFSSMADNALLLGLLVILLKEHAPLWHGPVLQGVYVAAFILLAPLVGVLSEIHSKRIVLMTATAIKLVGAIWILAGGTAFIGYAFVGMGAALYAPAKYGILPELLRTSELVKGNGIMDAVNVAALLVGAVLGGVLADYNDILFFVLIVLLYGFSLATSYFVKKVPPAQSQRLNYHELLPQFLTDVKQLWRVGSARIALIGTGTFWGTDATLKLLLLAWVPFVWASAPASLPSGLTALIAIGVSAGAAWAAMKCTVV